MFLWFIGTATVAVLFVFRDDRFDFRVLALGAVVPDLVDVWSGGAWVFHSVLGSVAVLAVVMATARRGSLTRRRWLALPIGMFFHLVFDGAFNNTKVFWWPFAGFGFNGSPIPSFDRPVLSVIFEIVGALLIAWVWRENSLSTPSVRREFLRTGHLRLIER